MEGEGKMEEEYIGKNGSIINTKRNDRWIMDRRMKEWMNV